VTPPAGADERPPIWVGHVGPLIVRDFAPAIEFYERLGLRLATDLDHIVSLEMRGGTHLVLNLGEPAGGEAPFDLMVDDVSALRDELVAGGLDVGPVERSGNHERLVVEDPDGYRVRIHDTHVVGPV